VFSEESSILAEEDNEVDYKQIEPVMEVNMQRAHVEVEAKRE